MKDEPVMAVYAVTLSTRGESQEYKAILSGNWGSLSANCDPSPTIIPSLQINESIKYGVFKQYNTFQPWSEGMKFCYKLHDEPQKHRVK